MKDSQKKLNANIINALSRRRYIYTSDANYINELSDKDSFDDTLAIIGPENKRRMNAKRINTESMKK